MNTVQNADNLTVNVGKGSQIPPHLDYVMIYFLQQELTAEEARTFFDYHQACHWKTKKGTLQRNWRVLAKEWIHDFTQKVKLEERQKINRTTIPPIELQKLGNM